MVAGATLGAIQQTAGTERTVRYAGIGVVWGGECIVLRCISNQHNPLSLSLSESAAHRHPSVSRRSINILSTIV